MNIWQLELELGRKHGAAIGFIANVISNGCSKPAAKMRGLAVLAEAERVNPGGDCYTVWIDGEAQPLAALEQYAAECSLVLEHVLPFEEWMAGVDAEFVERVGLSSEDLPDQCYADMYDAGMSAADVVDQFMSAWEDGDSYE